MKSCDVLIVGGGTAGMAIGSRLWEQNPEWQIILVEREKELGGVLRQCVHKGFGTAHYGGEMTGPEYLDLLKERFLKTKVQVLTESEVVALDISWGPGEGRTGEMSGAAAIVCDWGWERIYFRHVVLAAGSYERPVGSLMISGSRPEGIICAGELQRMINLEGYQPLGRAVIIGSGDISLIVARRLVLKGCTVSAIVEIQGQSPAMERNKKRCLEQYHLPLQVHSHVVEIHGEKKICGVTIQNDCTGENRYVECDFLVVAAGLIPDQSLLKDLQGDWESVVTLAGNCEKIYSIADAIVSASESAAREVYRKMNGRNAIKR